MGSAAPLPVMSTNSGWVTLTAKRTKDKVGDALPDLVRRRSGSKHSSRLNPGEACSCPWQEKHNIISMGTLVAALDSLHEFPHT